MQSKRAFYTFVCYIFFAIHPLKRHSFQVKHVRKISGRKCDRWLCCMESIRMPFVRWQHAFFPLKLAGKCISHFFCDNFQAKSNNPDTDDVARRVLVSADLASCICTWRMEDGVCLRVCRCGACKIPCSKTDFARVCVPRMCVCTYVRVCYLLSFCNPRNFCFGEHA
jgi:hypothetical protein